MVVRVWAGVGAVVCGALAATVGGGSSVLVTLIAIVAVAVGIGVTIYEWVRVSSGPRRGPYAPPPLLRDRPDGEATLVHGEQVLACISRRDVEWLRAQTFRSPWLDDHVEPFRQAADTISPEEAGGAIPALGAVINALHTFLAQYDGWTTTDTVVKGSSWRQVGRVGADGLFSSPEECSAAADRLADAAADVVAAHEQLRRSVAELSG